MDIKKVLNKTADKYSDKIAIIFKDENITFTQLRANVLKLANVLQGCGVEKGDRIAIYLPNGPEYIYSYLACFCLGAVGVPLDFMLKDDELKSCLLHSEAKVLIAKDKEDVSLREVKASLVGLETLILTDGEVEGALNYKDMVFNAIERFDEVEIRDEDPSLIMYTSGTTGKPKGILLNYKHLEGSPKAMEHFVDLSDKDIKLCAIPLSHIAGLIYIQNSIIFGITLILMDRFNPFGFLENVSKHRVTCFHIVPAMYMAMLSVKQIDKFDLSSLRWIVVFGAPSSPEILKRFHQYCPNARFLNGWGMTETCPPNTVTPMDSDNIASIGKPSPHCEIKILNGEGAEVSTGEIGEIVISGWVVMDCYYKDPEATAQLKQKDGLHTGDLGRFDPDGFLYIGGRKKEMIKVGGQIVFAPEVEAALYKNENVSEAAVIGMEDKMRGEVVKAFVVLKEGVSATEEDLKYFAKDHLAKFKVPQSIEIKTELPKNRTGKIDKEQLKQLQCAK